MNVAKQRQYTLVSPSFSIAPQCKRPARTLGLRVRCAATIAQCPRVKVTAQRHLLHCGPTSSIWILRLPYPTPIYPAQPLGWPLCTYDDLWPLSMGDGAEDPRGYTFEHGRWCRRPKWFHTFEQSSLGLCSKLKKKTLYKVLSAPRVFWSKTTIGRDSSNTGKIYYWRRFCSAYSADGRLV